MKRFLTVLISIAGFALIPTSTLAQDQSVCFMRDSSGRVVDLSGLCGGSSTKPRVFQAKIKRRAGGTPVIDVVFNGQQKFEMILDTGASQTTITPAMATALRLVPEGVERARVASGEIVEFPTARVASIGVGGAVVNNTLVSVGPVPLLGQNFFGDYDVIIKQSIVEFHAR